VRHHIAWTEPKRVANALARVFGVPDAAASVEAANAAAHLVVQSDAEPVAIDDPLITYDEALSPYMDFLLIVLYNAPRGHMSEADLLETLRNSKRSSADPAETRDTLHRAVAARLVKIVRLESVDGRPGPPAYRLTVLGQEYIENQFMTKGRSA
jgi:hypothetical protein